MAFMPEEIRTEALNQVFEQSKSSLEKELRMHLEDYFLQKELDEIYATAGCIKSKFFDFNAKISNRYIADVLKKDMNYSPVMHRLSEHDNRLLNPGKSIGKFYVFKRSDFVTEAEEIRLQNEKNTSFDDDEVLPF
jgi:hypothetical protein